MRTDAQLQMDVIDELRWDPRIRDSEIGVAVRGGVVTLTGTVPSLADKYCSERTAERITRARAVTNDLSVMSGRGFRYADTDIAHAVATMLLLNVHVPDNSVIAAISDGWVTLEGAVAWPYQRDAAEHTVSYLPGVRGVTNAITIRPELASPTDVSQRIGRALGDRQAPGS